MHRVLCTAERRGRSERGGWGIEAKGLGVVRSPCGRWISKEAIANSQQQWEMAAENKIEIVEIIAKGREL